MYLGQYSEILTLGFQETEKRKKASINLKP